MISAQASAMPQVGDNRGHGAVPTNRRRSSQRDGQRDGQRENQHNDSYNAPYSGPRWRVGAWIRHWWRARLPQSDSVTLSQRSVYIVPTPAGWMLALTLLVLLLAAINYQLNLGYVLVFLLAGSAVVGMHITHGTLRGLTLHLSETEPTYALQSAPFSLRLINDRASTRYAIAVSLQDSPQTPPVLVDVPPQGEANAQLAFVAARRGWCALPLVRAQTRYPLGIFRVWAFLRPASAVLVYPTPEAKAPPLPPGEPSTGTQGLRRSVAGAQEFDGVRPYQRGDAMKLIAWKAVARNWARGAEQLVSRDAQGLQRMQLWLSPSATGLADPEARLSRLCAWVLMAERQGLDYGLRLPGLEIPLAQGAAQQHRCLRALALS